MSQTGKLFVFEGPDGSGKTSLSRMFAEKLRACGNRCQWFSFPGREPGTLGNHVYDIHHNRIPSKIRRIHPASLQLLHIAAHIDTIERSVIPALTAGDYVVLDRYWWSTLVYGTVSGVKHTSLQAMVELEQLHWKGIRPAHLFLIRRENPSCHTPTLERISIAREYETLALREASNYPISQISNEGEMLGALNSILAAARLTDQKPPEIEKEPLVAAMQDCDFVAIGSLSIHTKLTPAKPTAVYDTYWRFATERQAIFLRRIAGQVPPWTQDPILQAHKFTNAYRASDRTSQYLIRSVIYNGDDAGEEVVFRTLLFKFFNRIQTWDLIINAIGDVSWRRFSVAAYDRVLEQAIKQGERIYSGAYIMPTGGPKLRETRKHRMHLKLLERMLKDELPARLADASSLVKAFEMLRSYPTIGDFLAFQYVIDLNYSNVLNFSEMDFVIPGPGARDGIHKCFSDFGGLSPADIIRWVTDHQHEEFQRLELSFQSLWGRRLQLIDCQNLFCEVDKYSRIAHPEVTGITGRTRIKQKFKASSETIDFFYPPKWHLNEAVAEGAALVSTV